MIVDGDKNRFCSLVFSHEKNRALGEATRGSSAEATGKAERANERQRRAAALSAVSNPRAAARLHAAPRRPGHGPPMATPTATALTCSCRPSSPSSSSAALRRLNIFAPVSGAHSPPRRRLRLAPLHGESPPRPDSRASPVTRAATRVRSCVV